MSWPLSKILFAVFILGFTSMTRAQVSESASASNKEVLHSADQLFTDFKNKVSVLKGHVQVIFKGQHLTCDEATIDFKTKKIVASGHVQLQSPTAYAEGSRLELNYESNTAILEDGFIQSGQVIFEGKKIERTGPLTYVATEAQYTACVSCPATWSFSGKMIDAELGGYAKIRRPVLSVGGIPIFILPSIMVPLKSARQTGLLVPRWGVSDRGGIDIEDSFFWAIDRSQDLTVTAKYYQFRGPKGLGEYRFVLSDQSRGDLKGAYLKDRAFEIPSLDRWFLRYEHYLGLPEGWVQRARVRLISDLRYLRDFPTEIEGHGDPALDNELSLTKNTTSQHLSIKAEQNVNLLKEYALASEDDGVSRFPEMHYALVDTRILDSSLLFRFETTYTHFARQQYNYDDLTQNSGCPGGVAHCAIVGSEGQIARDGQFDANQDIIRTGQRLEVKPSLSMPFQIYRKFDVIPEVIFREMQYRFDIDGLHGVSGYSPTAAQRSIEANVSLRTTFSKIFGTGSSPQDDRFKHEIEPEITYSNIFWKRRPENAFFGDFGGQRYARIYEPISDRDLFDRNRLQFDYFDRIFDKDLVELALTNRLVRKRWRDGSPNYERLASLRLSQSFDIDESRTERRQPWSAINSLLNMHLDNFETYTFASYNPYAKVTNTSSRIKIFNPRGNFAQFTYERIYIIDEDNVVTPQNQTENLGLGLGFSTKFIDLVGQIDYSNITSKILSWHYVASLKPPGNCWILQFGHQQVSAGRPEFRMNVEFNFGGEDAKKFSGI